MYSVKKNEKRPSFSETSHVSVAYMMKQFYIIGIHTFNC